jgi:hypothetical protein
MLIDSYLKILCRCLYNPNRKIKSHAPEMPKKKKEPRNKTIRVSLEKLRGKRNINKSSSEHRTPLFIQARPVTFFLVAPESKETAFLRLELLGRLWPSLQSPAARRGSGRGRVETDCRLGPDLRPGLGDVYG